MLYKLVHKSLPGLLLKSLRVLFAGLLLVAGPAQAQDGHSWDGQWIAEGTLFQVRVEVRDQVMTLAEVESLGFVWSSEPGTVEGDIARVPVQYAGVTGVVQVERIDAETAVAHAASCKPDFMVICVLAEGRQAVFKKVE